MQSSVETLEGNKVKLSVQIDDQEFDKAIDDAFKHLAHDVRLPGFRPGKAPRQLLEARIGTAAARQEALRRSLPDFYQQAVMSTGIEVIAPPEIDIVSGEEDGPVAFDAVVEVRPAINVPGYENLTVEIPIPEATEEEVESQVERLRNQYAELKPVTRPAQDSDNVVLDVKGYRHDETIDALSADDFVYEVGSKSFVPELDEHVRGGKPGDIFKFNAMLPDEQEASFQVLVKEVKEKVLPEVNDQWADEVSEFDTVEALKDDLRKRITSVKKLQTQMTFRERALDALIGLVGEDPPETLVQAEMQRRIEDLAMRLQGQGADLAQYLQATGKSQDDLMSELKETSVNAVRSDMALRAVAEAEGIEVSEEEVDEEIAKVAERVNEKAEKLRAQLDRAGQLPAVRSDLRKAKALEWLLEHVEVVDPDGRPVDRSLIKLEEGEGTF